MIPKEIKKYYNRRDVQEALLEFAKDREVVAVYQNQKFGKRPDVIKYPRDIITYVNDGAISFHATVERWLNPMSLRPGMTQKDLDELRTAWDLVIDPDVKDFEIAKIVTSVIADSLRDHGVKNFLLKYSGGKSFHIIVFFESFPEIVNSRELKKLYPDVPHKILEYLKWYTREQLKEELLSFETPIEIAERIGKKYDEIVDKNGLNPFKVVSIDLFGNRHLVRMPYSVNEKTFRISLPIEPKKLMNFTKEMAIFDKFTGVEKKFLKLPNKKDGASLLIQALDWSSKTEINVIKKMKKEAEVKEPRKKIKIPLEAFPPCMEKILNGLSDGRKRAIFVIITFLKNSGYSWEEIEKILYEWNERNNPPLRENYIRTQLRWHMRQDRVLMPPNCDHENFFKDMGVCEECNKKEGDIGYGIKNPLTYSFRKYKLMKEDKK
ncbi:MAG: hypothetical protein J7K83_02495 [Candidatus Aenigmarchaeota archaeon]|nr:hypothetical protein [Candidatus Aenigmarchaeota archaeon]